jgi:hypothetical protein
MCVKPGKHGKTFPIRHLTIQELPNFLFKVGLSELTIKSMRSFDTNSQKGKQSDDTS